MQTVNLVSRLNLKVNPPERILVIRRDNIGDLVCTTPALSALRKHYPSAKIGVLVNSYNAEVLRANPNVDHVFVYQKLKHVEDLAHRISALTNRLRLLIKIRCWQPQVTVLAKSSYDRHGLRLARQIGAKNIIGFAPGAETKTKSLPDIQLNPPQVASVHEVEAINQLLAPLGINDALGSLQVFPKADCVAALKSQLPDGMTRKRIALHLSAREPERRWGNDNLISLVKYILQTQTDTQILLLWSPGKADDPHHPGDDDAAAQINRAMRSDRLIPVATQTLTELIGALSLCDLFIGADGGAMHLAVGLNKKILALFENLPSKLNHWYPWQVSNRILCSPDITQPEIRHIPLIAVTAALESLLENNVAATIPPS